MVYLHGLVETNVERAAVEELAPTTAGVKRVVDSLDCATTCAERA